MSDDPTNEPIPGWPATPPTAPPSAGPSQAGPSDPGPWSPPGTVPPAPAGPPPGAAWPPASSGSPTSGPPPPGGYAAPPGGYAPPPGSVAPGGYPPAPGYGYPYQGYGYPMAREHPQGTVVLVLGICGWVLCGLCAPFAWVMGSNALKEIDANPTAYSNRGAVQAGRILGMAYCILFLVGVAFVLVLVVLGLFAGSSSST